jgi:hypothetical protein
MKEMKMERKEKIGRGQEREEGYMAVSVEDLMDEDMEESERDECSMDRAQIIDDFIVVDFPPAYSLKMDTSNKHQVKPSKG